MRIDSKNFIIWVGILLTGTAGPHAIAQSRAVRIYGNIDERVAISALDAINLGIKELIITSPGGDSRSAIKIAQAVKKYDVRVTVDKYCYSSCASFIFAASPNPTVMPGALVGFHQTFSSAIQSSSEKFKRAEENLYGRDAEDEGKLYMSAGVNLRLLVIPQYEIEPICIVPIYALDRIENIATLSRYNIWLPNKKEMVDLGLNVQGFPPNNHAAIALAISHLPPPLSTISYKVDQDGGALPTEDQVARKFAKMIECNASQRQLAERSSIIRDSSRFPGSR